jgi:membrane-bound inhibitor of C-type lysozyme
VLATTSTDPPTTRLEQGGTIITAFLRPSGSGARYEGLNTTFWNKGNEALVEWKGEKFECQTQ